jgi:ketosteroid isomerase-like protein
MSQENVELAHHVYDAFNRRDLEAFLAFLDAEVEFTPRFDPMEGGRHYHGHPGMRDWWQNLIAVFPDFSTAVLGVRDRCDFIVVALRIRAHGQESGAPFDELLWHAAEVRDGKVTWIRAFGSEAEALEAAGLPE